MLTADILGERARLTPEKVALVDVTTRRRYTYRELNERAVRCAQIWATQCSLKKGDRIGILSENRVEFLDAFFAAGKSGVILVPLSTRLTARELETIARDSGLKCLFFSGNYAETVRSLRRSLAVEHWVTLDEPLDSSDLIYQECAAAASPADWMPTRCQAEDVYCLLYTSGTTGRPKGVMIPHRMVIWNG